MKSPLENMPEYLQAIGTITVRWANVDLLLAMTMGILSKNMTLGHSVIFSVVSQSARIDMVIGSIRSTDALEEDKEQILQNLDNLKDLLIKRNFYIHNVYGVSQGESVSIIRHTPLRKNYSSTDSISLKQLKEHSDRVGKCYDAIYLIIHSRLVPSSHES